MKTKAKVIKRKTVANKTQKQSVPKKEEAFQYVSTAGGGKGTVVFRLHQNPAALPKSPYRQNDTTERWKEFA